ncbi:MAG: abortive infection system antitoxin AbiGi family protein [Gammaproteobacteria bacterium]|nr:abortive infection system antitoxin AbiGi family protein [Gammaproteobacteria bacterium]
MTLWLVRPPRNLPSQSYLRDKSIVILDFRFSEDLAKLTDAEFRVSLTNYITREHNLNPPTGSSMAGQIRQFVHEIEIGDLILVPDDDPSTATLGIVSGDYQFQADANERSQHARPVQWSSGLIDTGPFADRIEYELQGYTLVVAIRSDQFLGHLLKQLEPPSQSTGESVAVRQVDTNIKEKLTALICHLQSWKETKQRYVSDELHHFVGSQNRYDPDLTYATLKAVLSAGHLTPKPGMQDYHPVQIETNMDGNLREETYIKPSCVCFCDIPADDITVHAQKYGRFGISFRKSHIAQCGARPVYYLPHNPGDWGWARGSGSNLLTKLEVGHKALGKHLDELRDTLPEDRSRRMMDPVENLYHLIGLEIIAYVKPFELMLPDDHERQYYLEREWRLLGSFKFELDEVTRVFLPEAYADAFRADFPNYKNQMIFT